MAAAFLFDVPFSARVKRYDLTETNDGWAFRPVVSCVWLKI